jgi:hypothetical protein
MVDILFQLECPISDNWWKNLYNKSWKVTENKSIEIQLIRDSSLLGLTTQLRNKGDHPGFRFSLSILFITFDFQFYDGRHWDYENDCYEVYK